MSPLLQQWSESLSVVHYSPTMSQMLSNFVTSFIYSEANFRECFVEFIIFFISDILRIPQPNWLYFIHQHPIPCGLLHLQKQHYTKWYSCLFQVNLFCFWFFFFLFLNFCFLIFFITFWCFCGFLLCLFIFIFLYNITGNNLLTSYVILKWWQTS